MKHALVTGAAGFIGSHVVERLLREGWRVTGLDSFDLYYPRIIKDSNLSIARQNPHFRLVEMDIRDLRNENAQCFDGCDVIVHLAARAGVRPSLLDPGLYLDVNVCGTQRLLDVARMKGIGQFVFASSSSVYGVNPAVPWKENDNVLAPISPYAATKVCGELNGHVYSRLYSIRFIALRFFTVFGPRQRPDLAIFKMAQLIRDEQPVTVYGNGTTTRDYTYIDDIVDGIYAAIHYCRSPYEVINLGNSHTVSVLEMIAALETALGKKATIQFAPEQPGDVPRTWADLSKAKRLLNYEPRTPFNTGIAEFVAWLGTAHAHTPSIVGSVLNVDVR